MSLAARSGLGRGLSRNATFLTFGVLGSGAAALYLANQKSAQCAAEAKDVHIPLPPPVTVAEEEKSWFRRWGEKWSVSIFGEAGQLPVPPPQFDPMIGQPRTFVTNFEETLVYPTWTRKDGFLMRKRPHVDGLAYLLLALGYERFIWATGYTPDVATMYQDFDPYQAFAMALLGRDHTELVNFTIKRDLRRLNRDPRRIICLDAHKDTQFEPKENVIFVKPFIDDETDQDLIKVSKFLSDLSYYNVYDVRPYIAKFNANPDGDHFAVERAEKVQQAMRGPRGGRDAFSYGDMPGTGGGGGFLSGIFGGRK